MSPNMIKFVGRVEELSKLENIWESEIGKATVVYGRRRVGKSELLRKFASTRKSVYFGCIMGSLEDNLIQITRTMRSIGIERDKNYEYIEEALNDLIELCRNEKTLIVFDELPYLLTTGEHISSCLQHFMDTIARETDSMVVLCGSSVSIMKRETTDYERPLYGRIDHRLEILPLTFTECREFHPNMTDVDQLLLYLTIGGMPIYHRDSTVKDYRSYVIKHFIESGGDLKNSTESIISMEFAPYDRYIAIINAISDGKTSLKEISERTKLDKGMCIRCIDSMKEVGLIESIHPMMGSPSRPVYRIKDNIIAFCQTIVTESEALQLEDPKKKFEYLEQNIYTLLGHYFEDLCMKYVVHHWPCLEIGKWWGPDSHNRIQEIDIVAITLENDVNVALFGECKLRKSKKSLHILEELKEKSDLTKDKLTRRYVIFSAYGFHPYLEEEAEAGNVILVDLEDLINGWKKN